MKTYRKWALALIVSLTASDKALFASLCLFNDNLELSHNNRA